MVYENCKVYGAYTRKDGRKHVVIHFPNGNKKTVSYPKYIVELNLNRYLNENETVDHIDRDFNNNNLNNLIIREKTEHSTIDAKRVKGLEIPCLQCGKTVIISSKKISDRFRKGKASPFCSRECSGLYGANVQNKKSKKIKSDLPKKEYYYLEK